MSAPLSEHVERCLSNAVKSADTGDLIAAGSWWSAALLAITTDLSADAQLVRDQSHRCNMVLAQLQNKQRLMLAA